MKELYLAGDPKILEEAFVGLRGVEKVTPGKAVAQGGLEMHGVQVLYNPKKLDICGIMTTYFETINPYIIPENILEQSTVIYSSGEDIPQIEYYTRFLQNRGAEPCAAMGNLIINDSMTRGREMRPLQMRFGRLQSFSAE